MTERTIQFSDGTGNIQANNGSTVSVTNILPAESRPTRAVHLNPPPALFIGREPELAALHQHLAREGSVAYIPGFPGRGKSTLANFYAHQHKDEYQTVHWLPCHSKSLVEIAAEFAWQLELKLDGDLEANLRHLRGHCARNRCLLILDNVDDEAPAGMLLGGRSSVVITTWHTNLKFLRRVPAIPLPVFTEAQCFELFRTRIGAHEVDRHLAESRLLFDRLEHHPFALDIAGSLIVEDPRYTIADMAKNLPADIPSLFAEAIAALSPAAKSLLAAMAACAPEGFRLSLAAEVAGFDEAASLDALYEIRARSLADELDRDTHRYRLHTLVRVAADTTDAHHARHAAAVLTQFQQWETKWHQCEDDFADWRVAYKWSVNQHEDTAWSTVTTLAYTGYRLMIRLGHLVEAHEISVSMVNHAKAKQDNWCLPAWLGNQAVILKNWGYLDHAMDLHKQEEALCVELNYKAGLQVSYGNQAMILMERGLLKDAMILLQRKKLLCVELDDVAGVITSYGNQALILMEWNRLDDAMAVQKHVEDLCVKLDNKTGLMASYGNQAVILSNQKRLKEAMALLDKQEALCIQLGDKDGLARCLGIQGTVSLKEDLETARKKLQHSLALFTELGIPCEMQRTQRLLDRSNGLPETEPS